MEYYALEYASKTAVRITQSRTVHPNTQDSLGRRREGEPSRARSLLADDGRNHLVRRQYDVQTVDSERSTGEQLMLMRPWNIRGSPYNQAAFAYLHAQMLMDVGTAHVLDMWA